MLAYQIDAATEATEDVATDVADEGVDVIQDIQDGVSDVVDTFMEWLPNVVLFLVILVIGLFVAKLIARGVRKLFGKINLDYYLDKAGIGAPLERAGFPDSGKFVAKIFYYLVVLFVLKIAFGALGVEALNDTFDELILWIPKAIVALLLIVVGGLVANTVKDLVAGATSGQSYSAIVTKVAFFSVWMIFGLAALDQAEIAAELVDTLTQTVLWAAGAIMVIKFGVGGVWAARDRFWPSVYDSLSPKNDN